MDGEDPGYGTRYGAQPSIQHCAYSHPVCHALYRCGRYAAVENEDDDLFTVRRVGGDAKGREAHHKVRES